MISDNSTLLLNEIRNFPGWESLEVNDSNTYTIVFKININEKKYIKAYIEELIRKYEQDLARSFQTPTINGSTKHFLKSDKITFEGIPSVIYQVMKKIHFECN